MRSKRVYAAVLAHESTPGQAWQPCSGLVSTGVGRQFWFDYTTLRAIRLATSSLVLPSALRRLDMSSFAVNDALLAWWHVGVKQLSSVASAHDVASSLSCYTSEPLLPPSPQTMSTEGVQRL